MTTSPIRMARTIESIQDIDRLTEINGVPLEEIERRGRPYGSTFGIKKPIHQWSAKDREIESKQIEQMEKNDQFQAFIENHVIFTSYKGFLGFDDRFKEVLRNDWETVAALGTTHIELAQHLRNIISSSGNFYSIEAVKNSTLLPLTKQYNRITMLWAAASSIVALTCYVATNHFKYSYLFIIAGLVSVAWSLASLTKTKFLIIAEVRHRGNQHDLFHNTKTKTSITPAWNGVYTITNPLTCTSLQVGIGVITYIEQLGFYEGGKTNPYRIDPIVLVSTLTGIRCSVLQKIVDKKKAEAH